MLKRIIMIVMMMLLLISVGYAAAEQWEYLASEDYYNEDVKVTYHNQYYIDVNSIKKIQLGINEITKVKIKIIDQEPNHYSINQYWVNNDTKQYKLAFVERYTNDTLASQSDYRNQDWRNYNASNVIVREIIKRVD
jgi:hypothetical protein